ncbi:serine/threonine protein kinase [Hellea sp.]|nr:serine/threonine protein kinase [Hellea sp.]
MKTPKNNIEIRALDLFERALKRPNDERISFIKKIAGDDIDLFQRTQDLLNLDAQSGSKILTGHAVFEGDEEDLSNTEIGSYRILELIGKGGMGAVYKAERKAGDFTHNVAIKVIRPGVLSEPLVERFERERQTLADFSHPNIARLYDGGTTIDGAPYIIMEYVDGASITDFAQANNLTESDKLKLFTHACQAISYAHQNLIVHRDITPNNVLVTHAGDVKLIDFGISKTLDETTPPIVSKGSLDSLSFTPGFAAPERSKGAAANTLSDIYSLGKLLEALLESRTPSRDIKAIVSKATKADPTDRYSTVNALMQDILSFQRNRPVTAFQGGPIYKVEKFLKRQKITSGLAALVAVAAAVGYFNHTRAQTANIFAAERLSETREMTTFLLDDLPESLRTIPGTLPVQRQVTEISAKYLDVLSKAANSDPAVLFDYAMGHAQLGKILTVAGGANIGDPGTAFEHFKESLKTLKSLEASNPENLDLQLALAETEHDYAYALMYHQGDMEAGQDFLKDSKERYASLIDTMNSTDVHLGYMRVKLLDLFYSDPSEFQNNKELQSKIRKEYEDLISTYPDDKGTISQYAAYLRSIAHGPFVKYREFGINVTLQQKMRYEQGLKDGQRSLELIDGLLLKEPTNTRNIYQYVRSAENQILMSLVDKDWSFTFNDMVEELTKDDATYTAAELKTRAKGYPPISGDDKLVERVIKMLKRSDQMLAQIAPYDAQTFTHIEASYYNIKLHSYIQTRFFLDFEKAHEYNDKAKMMIDNFKAGAPDFRNAYLEDAVTHNEKAYIYMIEQKLMGGNKQVLICDHLSQAKELWTYSEDRWGEIVDYASDIIITNSLFDESGCG